MLTSTRGNRTRALAVGIVAALVSFSASAREEVVVYGTDAAVESERAELKAELKAYLESLNRELKKQLDEALSKQPAEGMKLALAEIPSRG